MKNKFMRIAAVMLMLCLVTTCAISGTFAKYTTEGAGEDSARVAYWGWTEADMNTGLVIDDLFADTYDVATNAPVKGANGEKIIAPGTANSTKFGIIYTGVDGSTAPEVAYKISVSTAGSSCAQAIQDNENITWTLDGTTYATWNELLDAIADLSIDEVAAGTLPTGFGSADTHEIGWAWAFHTDDAADAEDTAMGNTADLEVKIVITVTVTQIETITP